MSESLRLETLAVKAGRPPQVPDGPLNAPIMPAAALHVDGPSGYTRHGSPGWAPLEQALGALEGGRAVCFASGMGAASAALRGLAPGARVVAPVVVYHGVRKLLEQGEADVQWVDTTDTEAVIAACDGADLLWLESPANPLLDVIDLPAVCAHARERGVRCVVDSTMATPLLQRPLELGADVVMHSATKFIGGHADLLLGALVARDDALVEDFELARQLTGATPGALETFLALRGLRTLPLRLERAQANAAELARRLAAHDEVTVVRYPGLPDDPNHARAASFMHGFGAVLAFEVRGDAQRATAIAERTELFTHATSFGGVDSSLERRARWAGERAPETLLRVSVGIEHVEDLWADLAQALERR